LLAHFASSVKIVMLALDTEFVIIEANPNKNRSCFNIWR